jgi:hypothetical protein
VFGSAFGRQLAVAGIGIFSVRIDGRDFVDLMLEGSVAHRAGPRVGDGIVAVDGHPANRCARFAARPAGRWRLLFGACLRDRSRRFPVEVTDIRTVAGLQGGDARERPRDRTGRSAHRLRARVDIGHRVSRYPGRRADQLSSTPQSPRPGRVRDPWHIDGLVIDNLGKVSSVNRRWSAVLPLDR